MSNEDVFGLFIRVSIGYTSRMNKDTGLRIRVQRELRDQFLSTCKAQDKPAAQVIREFMRAYVSAHEVTPDSQEKENNRKGAEQ